MAEANWRSLYPFESNYRSLPAGRYHYLDEGRGHDDSGVLLMVHGNPTWSFYWRRLVTEFSDRFRVVVPDHLGCGLSDKPQNFSYRLQDHIDHLVGLVDDLGLRNVTLLGHDWGGAIGMEPRWLGLIGSLDLSCSTPVRFRLPSSPGVFGFAGHRYLER